ncbi:hypothetical protein HHL16_05730 [Pseudoflavitalea sp. G-6-1-2]|uniref:hypothetical protein n=1 Tax=Pseudoflavitalea sp. G-6-1-2 TaxID=2728841 RepID=UPI001469BDCB|nr:hypothetical protein [Pseudoflavitalea sp. G-6-1-2]NML20362.1 hypothetical protein [Pseudoflavitalea sp. G-6-1-2]
MKETTNQPFDLRVFELCRSKLQLTEEQSALISHEMQDIVAAEKQSWSQDLLHEDIADRKDWEFLMETNLDQFRRDMFSLNTGLHEAIEQKPVPPSPNIETLQWMFTYFAFQMGGIIAVILLLVKR